MPLQNNILDKIVAAKREELSSSKFRTPAREIKARAKDAPAALDFAAHLRPDSLRGQLPETRIIAEIKKASPSGGLLRPEYRPERIAREYIDAGAAALSVLTDGPFFQGSLADLEAVRQVSCRPILRKDFTIDDYQIYEARAHGADAILAIVAILEASQLEDFCGLAFELGMAALVEVHDETELQVALGLRARLGDASPLLGINNRNLKTLKTDLSTTEALMKKVPAGRVVVSESGLKGRADIERMLKAGAQAFLIGEHLLRERELGAKFKEMIGE